MRAWIVWAVALPACAPKLAGVRGDGTGIAGEIRHARRLIQRYRVKDFQNKSQIAHSLQDHLKIARAIQAGDEALAAQAMSLHVPAGSTGFSEFLAAVPGSFFEADTGSS